MVAVRGSGRWGEGGIRGPEHLWVQHTVPANHLSFPQMPMTPHCLLCGPRSSACVSRPFTPSPWPGTQGAPKPPGSERTLLWPILLPGAPLGHWGQISAVSVWAPPPKHPGDAVALFRPLPAVPSLPPVTAVSLCHHLPLGYALPRNPSWLPRQNHTAAPRRWYCEWLKVQSLEPGCLGSNI